jgi:hypothetical protein
LKIYHAVDATRHLSDTVTMTGRVLNSSPKFVAGGSAAGPRAGQNNHRRGIRNRIRDLCVRFQTGVAI